MNLDDTRLSSLMGEGKNGDIVVLGCPFDFARKRTIQKGGEENGPCCLRRFFSRVGPIYNSEYSIDLNKVKVTDAGNISLQL